MGFDDIQNTYSLLQAVRSGQDIGREFTASPQTISDAIALNKEKPIGSTRSKQDYSAQIAQAAANG